MLLCTWMQPPAAPLPIPPCQGRFNPHPSGPHGAPEAEPLPTLPAGAAWQMHSRGNGASSCDYLLLPGKDLVHWGCCWERSVYTSSVLLRYEPGVCVCFELGSGETAGNHPVCPQEKGAKPEGAHRFWMVTRSSLAVRLTHLPPRMRLHGGFLLSLYSQSWNYKYWLSLCHQKHTAHHPTCPQIQVNNYTRVLQHIRVCTYTHAWLDTAWISFPEPDPVAWLHSTFSPVSEVHKAIVKPQNHRFPITSFQDTELQKKSQTIVTLMISHCMLTVQKWKCKFYSVPPEYCHIL